MAQTTAPRVVVEFVFRNPTKRKWRFEETPPLRNWDTIYVPQSAFPTEPKRIRVTVEVIE